MSPISAAVQGEPWSTWNGPASTTQWDSTIRRCFSGKLSPGLYRGGSSEAVAEILPFKKDSFDALFCECVLSILNDGVAALCEFARVLKEGGFLIISDVFGQGGPGRGQPEAKSQGLRTKGLLAKEDLLGLLTRLGFSLLLWEEHERLLKEFVARMILAGERLPDPWGCRQGQEQKKTDRPQESATSSWLPGSGSRFSVSRKQRR